MLRCLITFNMAYPTIIYTEHFCFKSYVLLSEIEHKIIWQIRNSYDIRRYMDNSIPFSFEDHMQFVASLTINSEKAYYGVYYICGNCKLVGSQSIIKTGAECEAESGQYIFPSEQGNGYGTLMKYEFINYFFSHKLLQRVVEKIKVFNECNEHLNKKLGFRLYDSDAEYNYFEVTATNLIAHKI